MGEKINIVPSFFDGDHYCSLEVCNNNNNKNMSYTKIKSYAPIYSEFCYVSVQLLGGKCQKDE